MPKETASALLKWIEKDVEEEKDAVKKEEGLSERKGESWQEEFQAICEEMKRNGETLRVLPVRGKIEWDSGSRCPNCFSLGTFVGDELEYGHLYKYASARYCPACQKIYNVLEGINFAPYRQEMFLPIMKKKLIKMLQKRGKVFLPKGYPCPVCGSDTYIYHEDLGGIDYYDNYWRVCINPDCDWPGEHWETYEPGPYI